MAEAMTEINLIVGSMFTTLPDEDPEAYEEEREHLQDVQDLLREEGVTVDLLSEPGLEVWKGAIASWYDWLQLRRLAAHLERGDDIKLILGGAQADGEDVDDLLEDIMVDEAETRFPHLIKHRGDGGYYLPVEFAEPIWVDYGDEEEDIEEDDEEIFQDTTVSFGSSVNLLRELNEVEDLFNRNNVPMGPSHQALQVFKTAAEQSIDNRLPLILW
jgi:hypothetical protein